MPSALWFCNPMCFASGYLIKAKMFCPIFFYYCYDKILGQMESKGDRGPSWLKVQVYRLSPRGIQGQRSLDIQLGTQMPAAQLLFSSYTVKDPSQGMVPSTVVRLPTSMNEIKMTPS